MHSSAKFQLKTSMRCECTRKRWFMKFNLGLMACWVPAMSMWSDTSSKNLYSEKYLFIETKPFINKHQNCLPVSFPIIIHFFVFKLNVRLFGSRFRCYCSNEFFMDSNIENKINLWYRFRSTLNCSAPFSSSFVRAISFRTHIRSPISILINAINRNAIILHPYKTDNFFVWWLILLNIVRRFEFRAADSAYTVHKVISLHKELFNY